MASGLTDGYDEFSIRIGNLDQRPPQLLLFDQLLTRSQVDFIAIQPTLDVPRKEPEGNLKRSQRHGNGSSRRLLAPFIEL